MKILQHYSLRKHNTLGLDVSAAYFVSVESVADVASLCGDPRFSSLPVCILGGGSNVIFANDFPGLVIHVNLSGKTIIAESDSQVELQVAAGENWHETVLYSVEQGWWGIENLSLIPGTVGAAPIQNIGAYGVELREVFKELSALELASGKTFVFDKSACEFAYRDSVFKSKYPGQYLITSVTLKLNKSYQPNLSYTELEKEVSAYPIEQLSPKIVSNAVCSIRQRKLPDPARIGNVGSFFKNPVVSESQFQTLLSAHPEIRYFKVNEANNGGQEETQYKLAAAWLIDQCSWKGASLGDAGVYGKQALVLVNRGKAKPEEILQLAEKIKQSVKDKFDVELVREPVLIDLSDKAE